MKVTLPIRLESEVHLRCEGTLVATRAIRAEHLAVDSPFLTASGAPTTVRARDTSRANRGLGVVLTNLVGVRDGVLLKACPRCRQHKPLAAFGQSGRKMGNGEHRDQADCNACRGEYSG